MTKGARFTLVFSLLLCTAVLTVAQNTNSGDIRGTVKDSSGAVVPGVTVTVTNLDTAVTKQLVTNNDGLYDTAAILPGNYQLTFTRDGFDKLMRGPITVNVGIITVNADLRVGSTSQRVVVTENIPLLHTESPEQSTTMEAETLVNLPQVSTNGQNWGSFANLLPGASGSPSQPTSSGKSGDPGIAIAVNGNLPFYNNFLQDGASTTCQSARMWTLRPSKPCLRCRSAPLISLRNTVSAARCSIRSPRAAPISGTAQPMNILEPTT